MEHRAVEEHVAAIETAVDAFARSATGAALLGESCHPFSAFRVSWLISGLLFKARETVDFETPAKRARSAMVWTVFFAIAVRFMQPVALYTIHPCKSRNSSSPPLYLGNHCMNGEERHEYSECIQRMVTDIRYR